MAQMFDDPWWRWRYLLSAKVWKRELITDTSSQLKCKELVMKNRLLTNAFSPAMIETLPVTISFNAIAEPQAEEILRSGDYENGLSHKVTPIVLNLAFPGLNLPEVDQRPANKVNDQNQMLIFQLVNSGYRPGKIFSTEETLEMYQNGNVKFLLTDITSDVEQSAPAGKVRAITGTFSPGMLYGCTGTVKMRKLTIDEASALLGVTEDYENRVFKSSIPVVETALNMPLPQASETLSQLDLISGESVVIAQLTFDKRLAEGQVLTVEDVRDLFAAGKLSFLLAEVV